MDELSNKVLRSWFRVGLGRIPEITGNPAGYCGRKQKFNSQHVRPSLTCMNCYSTKKLRNYAFFFLF